MTNTRTERANEQTTLKKPKFTLRAKFLIVLIASTYVVLGVMKYTEYQQLKPQILPTKIAQTNS